jgi:hypothetical protein
MVESRVCAGADGFIELAEISSRSFMLIPNSQCSVVLTPYANAE